MDVRMDVILASSGSSAVEMIRQKSLNSELLLMGMAVPEPGQEQACAAQLIRLLDGLPTTILVRNSSQFQGRLVSGYDCSQSFVRGVFPIGTHHATVISGIVFAWWDQKFEIQLVTHLFVQMEFETLADTGFNLAYSLLANTKVLTKFGQAYG